ncbi:hypothetical protein N7462_006713 [Penicillium macrosclerotiorum]|uniref:uncharacterized protein n=1 Tax=Penicillium macrosclerotiorum TaxID=303699 RepID=UPI0025490583|nr:uncharacterized protein N7462_006713 [Penicillium macrosclerotiorum]KAJ5683548.1 hypothetical protein N7462_006713 [Penicillium macrosclerotiorum]
MAGDSAGRTILEILTSCCWTPDCDNNILEFREDGTGNICLRRDQPVFIAFEFDWKPLDPTDLHVEVDKSERWLGGTQDLAHLKLEITLTKRPGPLNEHRLRDTAFCPKTFTIRLEKGIFPAPFYRNNPEQDPNKTKYALRLLFDTSLYPSAEDWKETRFGQAGFGEDTWEWREFTGKKVKYGDTRSTMIYIISIILSLGLMVALFINLSSGMPTVSSVTASQESPTISLDYATYQGVSLTNGVDQYLGMRFAKAPTGNLRFRAPQDPDVFNELQHATEFGPICVGVGQSVSATRAEDCLFVNVWKPANASINSNLPVWLFIQGGGYSRNSNANYNGSTVVEESGHDIVFVNFNYRVGVLGFLASKEMQENGDLNAGLLDQRKVLSWIQTHIRDFGGNPDHVVLHGDSAGAGSVAHHLTAYGGRDLNLFVGAVAESVFWPTQRSVAEMAFQYQNFLEVTGCDVSADPLSCLRSLDITMIQKHNVKKPFPGGSDSPVPLWYFLPVVDGDLVPDRLYSLFQQGKFIHVPLMVTDDTNEGTPFGYNAINPAEMAQFIKNNYPRLSDEQLSAIQEAYPKEISLPKHEAYFPSASKAYGEATFTCPGNMMAASMSKYYSPDNVWNYRFNVLDPTEASSGMGVPHVFELPSIFGLGETNLPDYSFATTNANIVPVTMNYYLSFVKELNPNTLRLPRAPFWESWGIGTGQRLKLQTNSSAMEVVPQVQLDRCLMWERFAAAMQH